MADPLDLDGPWNLFRAPDSNEDEPQSPPQGGLDAALQAEGDVDNASLETPKPAKRASLRGPWEMFAPPAVTPDPKDSPGPEPWFVEDMEQGVKPETEPIRFPPKNRREIRTASAPTTPTPSRREQMQNLLDRQGQPGVIPPDVIMRDEAPDELRERLRLLVPPEQWKHLPEDIRPRDGSGLRSPVRVGDAGLMRTDASPLDRLSPVREPDPPDSAAVALALETGERAKTTTRLPEPQPPSEFEGADVAERLARFRADLPDRNLPPLEYLQQFWFGRRPSQSGAPSETDPTREAAGKPTSPAGDGIWGPKTSPDDAPWYLPEWLVGDIPYRYQGVIFHGLLATLPTGWPIRAINGAYAVGTMLAGRTAPRQQQTKEQPPYDAALNGAKQSPDWAGLAPEEQDKAETFLRQALNKINDPGGLTSAVAEEQQKRPPGIMKLGGPVPNPLESLSPEELGLVVTPKAPDAPPVPKPTASGRTSDSGLDFIRRQEGFTPTAAWDVRQHSIGYGTKGQPGETITREEADRRLQEETGQVSRWIAGNITAPLTQNQHDALVSFGFNLGTDDLEKLKDDINAGALDRVANRMLSFNKAAGKTLPGLVRRRREEAELLLAGGEPMPTETDLIDRLGAVPPERRPEVLREEVQRLTRELGIELPAPSRPAPAEALQGPWQQFQAPKKEEGPWTQFAKPEKPEKKAAEANQPWQLPQGFVGALVGTNPKLVGHAAEGFGELLENQTLIETGKKIAGFGTKQLEGYKARVPSFTDIRTDSIGGFLADVGSYAAYGTGAAVGTSAPSLVTGGLAALGTANPVVGLAVGAFGPSYIQNYGDVFGSSIEDAGIAKRIANGELTRKGVAKTAAWAAVPIAALDATGLGVVWGKVSAEAKKSLTRAIVKGIATGTIVEGTTEGLQEVISQWAQHELGSETPAYQKFVSVMDNVFHGAFGGGAMGGGASVLAAAKGGAAKAPPAAAPPVGVPKAAPDAAIPPLPGGAAGDLAVVTPAPLFPDEPPEELGRRLTEGLAPDRPTAEPFPDLLAQARDLADPTNDRAALFLSAASIDTLTEHQFARLARVYGGGVVLEDFDGQGGMLVVKDQEAADAAEDAKDMGTAPQVVVGILTGSGVGKPIQGTQVVQPVTPEGAVARESLVTPSERRQVMADFAAPGREVRALDPKTVLERRDVLLGRETEAPVTEVGRPSAPAATAAQFPGDLDFSNAAAGPGSRAAPVVAETADDVAVAGLRVAEPTEAQKAANNYRLGHAVVHGLDVSIETPKGAMRRGDGWEAMTPAAYGYIRGFPIRARDGEHPDVYVGDDPLSGQAFVIDQNDLTTGRFDEPKIVLGVRSVEEATALYDAGFSDGKGPQRRAAVHPVSIDDLKTWLESGDGTRPFAEWGQEPADAAAVQGEAIKAADMRINGLNALLRCLRT